MFHFLAVLRLETELLKYVKTFIFLPLKFFCLGTTFFKIKSIFFVFETIKTKTISRIFLFYGT